MNDAIKKGRNKHMIVKVIDHDGNEKRYIDIVTIHDFDPRSHKAAIITNNYKEMVTFCKEEIACMEVYF